LCPISIIVIIPPTYLFLPIDPSFLILPPYYMCIPPLSFSTMSRRRQSTGTDTHFWRMGLIYLTARRRMAFFSTPLDPCAFVSSLIFQCHAHLSTISCVKRAKKPSTRKERYQVGRLSGWFLLN
jgi:hypothetical protein